MPDLLLRPKFPENCKKIKEIGPGGTLASSRDPPMTTARWVTIESMAGVFPYFLNIGQNNDPRWKECLLPSPCKSQRFSHLPPPRNSKPALYASTDMFQKSVDTTLDFCVLVSPTVWCVRALELVSRGVRRFYHRSSTPENLQTCVKCPLAPCILAPLPQLTIEGNVTGFGLDWVILDVGWDWCTVVLIGEGCWIGLGDFVQVGTALTSDLSASSFVKVVYEKIILVLLWTEKSHWTLKIFLIDSHYKLFVDQSEVSVLSVGCVGWGELFNKARHRFD